MEKTTIKLGHFVTGSWSDEPETLTYRTLKSGVIKFKFQGNSWVIKPTTWDEADLYLQDELYATFNLCIKVRDIVDGQWNMQKAYWKCFPYRFEHNNLVVLACKIIPHIT